MPPAAEQGLWPLLSYLCPLYIATPFISCCTHRICVGSCAPSLITVRWVCSPGPKEESSPLPPSLASTSAPFGFQATNKSKAELKSRVSRDGAYRQVLLRSFWECHCALPLPVACCHLLEDHQEAVDGGLLRRALQHDAAQLPPISLVRPAVRVPEQHPGVDDQRDGVGDRGHLRGDLPHLRGGPAGQAPHAGPPQHRRLHLHRRGAHLAAGPPWQRPQGLLRPRRHHLLHLHVRIAALHHEVGDQDEERGVHAVPALPGRVPVRHLLVHLRPPRPRPLHHYPQRVRELPGPGAAHPLRHLPEKQGPRRAGRQGRGRCCRGRGGREEGGRCRGAGRRHDHQQGSRHRRRRQQGRRQPGVGARLHARLC